MSEGTEYFVLCEDLQSYVFIRRALIATGATRIRKPNLPSDVAVVLKRYADEVTALRRKVARMKAALVVHVDADGSSVVERHRELAKRLSDARQPPRQTGEAIAELVPKRNIETWIHHLLGTDDVNEKDAYPKFKGNESKCWPAADSFARHAKAETSPNPTLPSLDDGLAEFRRLL